MALIVEDGTGVPGAESLASVAFADAYWAARTNRAYAATWTAATTAAKEGALREATAYLNSLDGSFRGVRRGYVQGCVWPRTDALDDARYPLPALPDALRAATAELAVRSLSAELVADQGRVTSSESVGPLSVTYEAGQKRDTYYRAVDNMLAPLMKAKGWSWL